MQIEKISPEKFFTLRETLPVIDVRSPAEYAQAHIPGAVSLPLFSDEERKIVGTAYKQQSREAAIKIGLDFFGPKMRSLVEEAERLCLAAATPVAVILYCWRGGMRSAGVAWLLDLYGFRVYTLIGGYKKYRAAVLAKLQEPHSFYVVGGYTGSGKTLLLHELARRGKPVVDLEKLANHKGSALGGAGKGTQPRQEMFENLMAEELTRCGTNEIFIEDESRRIGDLQIPAAVWENMRRSRVCFFDIPFEARLVYVTQDYGREPREKLINAIMRIQKRLGGLETKNAIGFLVENNYEDCFRILLKYYDRYYEKSLWDRADPALVHRIEAPNTDAASNAALLLQHFILKQQHD